MNLFIIRPTVSTNRTARGLWNCSLNMALVVGRMSIFSSPHRIFKKVSMEICICIWYNPRYNYNFDILYLLYLSTIATQAYFLCTAMSVLSISLCPLHEKQLPASKGHRFRLVVKINLKPY